MQYNDKNHTEDRTSNARESNSDEVSISTESTQSKNVALWIEENILWDAAAGTSITQRDRFLNWSRTVIPGTLRWSSTRIVRETVASFSGLNTHNFTNRTSIHSEVSINWTRISTTMKRLCVHAYNTTAVMQLSSHS